MTLTKDQLAFVLVPGSFCTPYVYHKLTAQLTAQGHTVVQAPLLSAGDRTPLPPAGMYDDAAAIHAVLTRTLATGKSVVLVMLSYGGIPGTEAVRGLTPQDLGADQPAVVQLVYLSAILLGEGVSSNERFAEEAAAHPPTDDGGSKPVEPSAEVGEYMHLSPEHPGLIFNDVPDEATRQHYFESMPVHAARSFAEKLTYAAYKDVKAVYVLTDADKIVVPRMQHEMVDRANATLADSRKIKKVVLEGSGHVAVVSRPEEVTDILVGVADELVGSAS